MARGLNKVQLIGNLGGDPETKYLPSGALAAILNIATSDGRKNAQGEWEDFTEWHRVVLYGRRAEICREYLHKGSRVYIEGRLHTRSWDDNNGQKHYMTEIVGTDILMLDSREQPSTTKQSHNNPIDSDDDLPF